MPTVVWPGTPGNSYQNNTNKILYQVHCLWHNTCAACAQYDLVVVEWFSQLHRNCQCYIVPIMPGDSGAVYHDWRDTIAGLSEAQQKELMGASNWKLYQEGVVQWEDIVHESSILTLQELVSVKGLTIDQLIDAGIPRNIAEKVWESVNTPAHLLAEQNKQALVKKLLEIGIQPKTLKQLFGEQMAKGIGLQGPSGTTNLPGNKTAKQWVSQLLNELKGKISGAITNITQKFRKFFSRGHQPLPEDVLGKVIGGSRESLEPVKRAYTAPRWPKPGETQAPSQTAPTQAPPKTAIRKSTTTAKSASKLPNPKQPIVKPPSPMPSTPSQTSSPKPTKAFVIAGNPNEANIQQFEQWLQKIPQGVREILDKFGTTFVYAEKLIDQYPNLKGVTPRGWTAGSTWENLEGLYQNTKREVTVAEKRIAPGSREYSVTLRGQAALIHETGHGLDQALQDFSLSQQWRDVHATDVANIHPGVKGMYAYFTQPGATGLKEAFAEIFAESILGTGPSRVNMAYAFPESTKLMQSLLKGIVK